MSNDHLSLKLRDMIYDRCARVLPRGCNDQCNDCQIGISISEIDTSLCPICGSSIERRDDRELFHVGYRHVIYRCGTAANICSHYNKRPNSITSIVQGKACYRPEDDII